MELITPEIEEKFKQYPIGSQETLGGNAKVIVKFFNPVGVGTWIITEGNKLDNGDYEMFGYAHLGDDDLAEFGYIYLSELKELQLPYHLSIERDLYLPKGCDLVQAMKRSGIKPPDFILENYKNGGKEAMSEVVEKLKKEYEKYIEECKEKGIDFIIKNAEEIANKKYIIDVFVKDYYGEQIDEEEPLSLNEDEEKAILDTDNSLNALYKNYKSWEKQQIELKINSRVECVDVAVENLKDDYEKAKEDKEQENTRNEIEQRKVEK